MAKKRAAKKKTARRAPARKKAVKKVARQASEADLQRPISDDDTIDLSAVDEGAVQAADILAAEPVTPPAAEVVTDTAAEVAAALPEVEAQAQRQHGPLAELVAYREVLWLVGPARRPRSAIVGRALAHGGGVSEVTARSYQQACAAINEHGPRHLREEFTAPLRDYDSAPARHSRTLANLLGPAVSYLCHLDLVRLGARQGMFLAGRGPVVFEGWPEWERRDEEPRMPRRGGQREEAQPAAGLVPPPPGEPPPPAPTGEPAPPAPRPPAFRRRLIL
jgi:hypothetical protein